MTSDFFFGSFIYYDYLCKDNVNDILECKDWLRYIKGGKDKNHC